MVVEITEDVVEYLESHKEELNDQSDIIVMLDEIARQCYEHHHVIYAEVDVLEYLKNCGILENRSKRVFSALFRRAFKLKIKPKSDYPLKTLYPRAFQTGQNHLIYYDFTTVE